MSKLFQNFRTKFLRRRRLHHPRRMPSIKFVSRHPFAVPVVTFGLLASITAGVYFLARDTNNLPPMHDAKIVIISHDHQQQIVPSKEATVGSLMRQLHLTLHEGDVVEPAQTSKINQDQFRINIYRAVPVEIVDGNHHTFTFSASKTPRAIAQQAGTTMYPEDLAATTPAEDFIKTGSIGHQVVIDRALPVTVDLYGTKVVLRTHAKTVGELIKEKNIKLNKNDQIVPVAATPLTGTQQVTLLRTGTKIETNTESIAMPIQRTTDESLAYGTSAVRQQGSDGQQVVTYQVAITNNVETGRTVIQKVITKQPVTQIEVTGSSLSGIKGDMALAGISPDDYEAADYIISHESGWCPTKAQGQYGGCPAYAGSVPAGGGYGLCQSTPGSKMASAGADWATNPITQLRWCASYASRYGGWQGAYAHWLSYHNW